MGRLLVEELFFAFLILVIVLLFISWRLGKLRVPKIFRIK